MSACAPSVLGGGGQGFSVFSGLIGRFNNRGGRVISSLQLPGMREETEVAVLEILMRCWETSSLPHNKVSHPLRKLFRKAAEIPALNTPINKNPTGQDHRQSDTTRSCLNKFDHLVFEVLSKMSCSVRLWLCGT